MLIQGDTLNGGGGHATGEQVIECRAEAVDIRPGAGLSTSGVLFGWGVAFGAGFADKGEGLVGAGEMFFGDAKVHQHGIASGRDDDIRGLDIAMEDGGHARVQVVEGVADGEGPAEQLLLWERATAVAHELLVEIFAVYEVHDEIEAIRPAEMLAHLGDVVVVEGLEPLTL